MTVLISEVNWPAVISTAGIASILSLLASITTGLPKTEGKLLDE